MPKFKTRKTAAKRLKIKKGKILREVRGISHLRTKKTSSQKKRTSNRRDFAESDIKRLKKMVPGAN